MNQVSTEILFDKFEIIECLKKDGQSAVYLANHIFLGKKIILKTLNTDGLSDKTILERFKREAKILALLDHPNLIKVLDFGMFKDFFYISFEYFESRNLREIISHNQLSDDEKINLIIQLLKALNVAHQNQIIHRDIKPENILINSNSLLKIADFGLAMVVTDNNITQSASIVGTPGYMSPEQIRGEKTQQTDIFSTGIVCFELFTGKNPVLGNDVGATINNILNFRLENISNEIAKLPVQVQPAINSMLQSNLTNRAKSVAEVLKLFGVEVEENRPVNIDVSKKRLKKSFIILAVVLIIAAAGVIWYSGSFTKNLSSTVSPPKSINEPLTAVKDNRIVKTGNLIKKEDDLPRKVQKESIVPVDNSVKVKVMDNNAAVLNGSLTVNCNPWAEVYVDNTKIDTTPVKGISLKPGKHLIKLAQPDYPPYVKTIDIVSGRTSVINVNFKELVGYLNCNIYPWGDIYINGKFMATTPLQNKPIALYPGTYQLIIKSANYSPVSKDITITAKQTTNFSLNFKDQNN